MDENWGNRRRLGRKGDIEESNLRSCNREASEEGKNRGGSCMEVVDERTCIQSNTSN